MMLIPTQKRLPPFSRLFPSHNHSENEHGYAFEAMTSLSLLYMTLKLSIVP